MNWTNIIGYGIGDMANNFVFSMGALFLLNYYTDVSGISAAYAGTLLVAVRIYNAFTDIAAGFVIDRASTRWGCCRPFFLWGGLPLLLLSVAVFSVPANWNPSAKLIYAYVTYTLLVTAYSFVNIPYGSLASLMTQVPRERAYLSTARTFIATISFTLISMVIGPMIQSSHGDSLQSNLRIATLIFAASGAVLYMLCFQLTREVIVRDALRPKFMDSVRTLRANHALLILCASMLCLLAGIFSMNASAIYFARYILGDAGLLPVIFGLTTMFGVLVSAPLAPWLVQPMGKRNTFLLGIAIAALGYFALYFSPATNKVWIFFLFGIIGTGEMMAMVITWALIADTVEYGEWRTGLRIEGLTYSLCSFSRKCGQAIGGSVPAFLLSANGYVPNLAIQSETARSGIQLAVALIPGIAFTLAFVLMFFYPLTERNYYKLVDEIERRRRAKIS
ncbi:glucuronide transporter [Rouxiella aceris]|uniref:glucuronide transporter n=1 Tax=Rouxiella aceris TaxID=2703884 RepID=UPI002852B4AA|nr:glucuronide transporter [Rouxiella aceris]